MTKVKPCVPKLVFFFTASHKASKGLKVFAPVSL